MHICALLLIEYKKLSVSLLSKMLAGGFLYVAVVAYGEIIFSCS